jgi:hypothetical protein
MQRRDLFFRVCWDGLKLLVGWKNWQGIHHKGRLSGGSQRVLMIRLRSLTLGSRQTRTRMVRFGSVMMEFMIYCGYVIMLDFEIDLWEIFPKRYGRKIISSEANTSTRNPALGTLICERNDEQQGGADEPLWNQGRLTFNRWTNEHKRMIRMSTNGW